MAWGKTTASAKADAMQVRVHLCNVALLLAGTHVDRLFFFMRSYVSGGSTLVAF